MSNASNRIELYEAILELIEKKRAESGDESLGEAIEHAVIDSQFREVETRFWRTPGRLSLGWRGGGGTKVSAGSGWASASAIHSSCFFTSARKRFRSALRKPGTPPGFLCKSSFVMMESQRTAVWRVSVVRKSSSARASAGISAASVPPSALVAVRRMMGSVEDCTFSKSGIVLGHRRTSRWHRRVL